MQPHRGFFFMRWNVPDHTRLVDFKSPTPRSPVFNDGRTDPSSRHFLFPRIQDTILVHIAIQNALYGAFLVSIVLKNAATLF